MMQTIKLSLPELYPQQQEVADHPAKRKVLSFGRRGGKTFCVARIATDGLLQNKKVLLSSTSQDQSDVFWYYITKWTRPLLDVPQLYYKNESRRIMRFMDGEIQVKTGRDPDALRSKFADVLALDECAYLDPRAWREVGAPLLADTNGTAYFISSPKRRNWFFELFQKAQSGDDPRWKAWQFPSHINPYLSKTALAELASDMTEEMYQQEILAQFLEGEGSVFRYITERATAARRDPYQGQFVFGVDWAQQHDYTVIVVLDIDTHCMVDMARFNQVDWSLQRGRIKTLYDQWQPQQIIAEKNSIGSPNIEALQKEGLPVVAFETTAVSKPPLIESLVLAFDRHEITVLNDAVLTGELAAYERKVSHTTGRSQYSAPQGLHDDCVMALALAWYGASHALNWSGVQWGW